MAASVTSMINDRISGRTGRSGVPSLPVLTPVLSTDRNTSLRQWQLPPKPQGAQSAKPVQPEQNTGASREPREPRQLNTAPTPRQDRQASEVALTELIRALRRLSAGEHLDEVSLEKLVARSDPAATTCVQLVRSIQLSLQEKRAGVASGTMPAAANSNGDGDLGDSAANAGQMEGAQAMQDKQQLSAQVAFLERKIAKLREKVKKRSGEASNSGGTATAGLAEPGQGGPEADGFGTSKPSREKLISEIERLRSETARGGSQQRSAGGPRSASGSDTQASEEEVALLKARILEMQGHLATLDTEKEAAEASAEKARRLVASVETRLRSVVSSREVEQAQLLEQQRQLQATLEAQNAQLAELEKVSDHCQERDRLQTNMAELHRELIQARLSSGVSGTGRIITGPESVTPGMPSQLGAGMPGAVGDANWSLSTGGGHRKNSTGDGTASAGVAAAATAASISKERPDTAPGFQRPAVDVSLRKAYEQALREQAEAQGALEQKARSLSQQKENTKSQVEKLEADIQQAKDDAQAVLAGLEKEHASELQAFEQQHRSQLEQATEASIIEEQKQLNTIQEDLQAAESNHRSKMEAIRSDAAARGSELEAQSAALDAEIRRAQRHAELARREREFRGAVWLTVRRASFRPCEMIAYLSNILELPARRIRIIDDDSTPEVDAPVRSVAQTPASVRSLASGVSGSAFMSSAMPKPPDEPVPLLCKRPVRRGRKHVVTEDTRDQSMEESGYFTSWRKGATKDATEQLAPSTVDAILDRGAEQRAGTVMVSSQPDTMQLSASRLDPSLRRIFLELIDDPVAPAHLSSGFSVAVRLVELLRQGDPRAEPLAVVRAAVARGENVMASAWPGETAGVVERRVRKVQGWLFVITVFLNLEPFIVKFAAFDDEEGREFHLHLDEEDVNALATGASSLRPLEMIEAIVPALRVINRDGRLMLAAVQEVTAPPTITNEVDPVLAETARLSARYRRHKRQLMQKRPPATPPPMQPPPTQLALQVAHKQLRALPGKEAEALTLINLASSADGSTSWNVVREDVLMLGDRFVLLCAEHDILSGDLRLTLQEAGRCRPFHVLLPGNSLGTQQRVFAQLCDLGGLSLHLMVEEIASPPLLVVRVVSSTGGVFSEASGRWGALSLTSGGPSSEMEETTLCIATDDWRAVDPELLTKCPVVRREQLLQFLVQMPLGAKVAVEGLNAVSLAAQGFKTCVAGASRSKIESRVSYGPGLTCFAQVNASAWIRSRAKSSSWSLLAQGGRRLLQAGEERLHVVRSYHRSDPYSHFMVLAHQVGTCREWEMLVSAEDVLRYLPKLGSSYVADAPGRRPSSLEVQTGWNSSVAHELLGRLVFVSVSGREVLTLRCAEDSDYQGAGPSAPTLAEVRVLVANSPEKAIPVYGQEKRSTSDAATLVPAGDRGDSSSRALAIPVAMPDLFERACFELAGAVGAKPSGALLPAGGRFVDLRKANARHDAQERTVLHVAKRTFGDLEIGISVEALPSGRGHVLSAHHEPSFTLFELTLATRDGACPEKFCVEHVSIAGKPLVLVLAEASFPHALHALVRDPASAGKGKEFRCTLRDEDIFAMLPRSQRLLLQRCAEEIVEFGAIGEQGAGTRGFTEMKCGPVASLPSVTLEQVDSGGHFVIPVLRVPFSPKEAHPVGESPGESNELPVFNVGSTSFVACDRTFNVTLTKSRTSEDFTLGIGEVDSGSMHLMQLCDRFSRGDSGDDPPMSLYSEVRELAGVSLLVFALLDAAPRALRVAIIELASQLMCQLVVLDEGGGPEVLPLPDPVPARQQLLNTYLTGFCAAPMTPISTRVMPTAASPATLRPPSSPSKELSSASLTGLAVSTDVRKQPKLKVSQLIFRTTRKLPSGQPVVLSVVREKQMDRYFRFHVLMYHPVTAREMKIALVNPLLDKVLNACGLEDSMSATLEQVDAKGKEVALEILSYAYVHPDGEEIEFRTTAIDARATARKH